MLKLRVCGHRHLQASLLPTMRKNTRTAWNQVREASTAAHAATAGDIASCSLAVGEFFGSATIADSTSFVASSEGGNGGGVTSAEAIIGGVHRDGGSGVGGAVARRDNVPQLRIRVHWSGGRLLLPQMPR